jgi:hypothetical protein
MGTAATLPTPQHHKASENSNQQETQKMLSA